ncbi:hypothetical protein J6590_096928 [Homalodisca vitripennis]|nr:hypothetical protein J6590_092980 [Homalodisca vitripennis]KAG8304304.1 hypothetical protein J6590_096928 [Homalodisca vitripennis]
MISWQRIPNEAFAETYDRTDYEGNAEIYLKAKYEDVSSDEINDLLRDHKYNLIDICKKLDGRGSKATPFDPDEGELLPSATECFRHEVWYAEHRLQVDEFQEMITAWMRKRGIQYPNNSPFPMMVWRLYKYHYFNREDKRNQANRQPPFQFPNMK